MKHRRLYLIIKPPQPEAIYTSSPGAQHWLRKLPPEERKKYAILSVRGGHEAMLSLTTLIAYWGQHIDWATQTNAPKFREALESTNAYLREYRNLVIQLRDIHSDLPPKEQL